MAEKEIEFIDAESSYQKESSSFKDLVLRHLEKISVICTKEFKEGYWDKKPIPVGPGHMMSEVYYEDTRECYINAVDYLHDILIHIFDKGMKKASNQHFKKLNKRFQKNKDMKKTDWYEIRLKLSRRLFQQITKMIHRIKLFETVVWED